MKFYNSDINSLIADAIINYKELYLNGICTLSCKLHSAQVDSNGAITPPRHIIEIKKLPSNQNNNIIKLLSAAFNIQEHEAIEVYNKWLKNIENSNENNTFYTIAGVGVIGCSVYNSLSFKVERQFLSNLNFLNEKLEDVEPIAAATSTLQNGSTIEEPKNSIIEKKTDSNSLDNKEKGSNNTKIIIISIIIIILLALTGFLVNNCSSKKVIEKPKIEEPVIIDSVAVVKEVTPKVETIRDGRFHVICGVYEEPANAERSVASYSAEGYTPIKEFFNEKERFYISLKGFEDKSEAQKLLNSITPREEEGEDGYLWIYQYEQ